MFDGSLTVTVCTDVGLVDYREAKQVGGTKSLADVISDLGSIESVRCNCNGTRVSVLVNKVSHARSRAVTRATACVCVPVSHCN